LISRDQILQTLLNEFKSKFGFQIDFDNPNLETWLVQTLSILDENQLMYLSLLMNESFLSTAVLPSTIKKFAIDYGYRYKTVQPATGYVDLYIAYNNSTNIDAIIDYDTEFQTDDGITYIPQYKVYITYSKHTNIANIIAYDVAGNKFVLPYTYEVISKDDTYYNVIHFQLPVIQAKREILSFIVSPSDVVNYKFPTYTIPFPTEGQLSNLNVYVSGVPAERKSFLFELDPDKYSFVLLEAADGYQLIFGNGLIGKNPNPGDTITVELLTSLGSKGNVYANTLSLTQSIINKATGNPLNIIVHHPDILNGQDAENPNDIRLNTIKQLHKNDRLVTHKDFEFLAKDKLPFQDVKTIFTVSDLFVNEICMFGFFTYKGKLVKSLTGKLTTESVKVKQFTPVYQNNLESVDLSETKENEDALEFVVPFEIDINTDTMVGIVYYYPHMSNINFKVVQESYYSVDHQSYAKLNQALFVYDKKDRQPKLRLNYLLNVNEFMSPEDNIQLEVNLTQSGKTYNLSYNKASFDTVSNILTIDVDLPDTLTEDFITGTIALKYKYATQTEYEMINYVELSPFYAKYNISAYTPIKVKFEDKKYIVYGVPAIEYIEDIIEHLNQLYISGVSYIEERKMLTNKVAIAFGKTVGLLMNSNLSRSPLNSAKPGQFEIPVKLHIKAYVHTMETSSTIQQRIKKLVMSFIQPSFDIDIIRSTIVKMLYDNLDYLKDVEVYIVDKNGNLTEEDISIHIDSYDIPKDQVLTFVPEIIGLQEPEVEVIYV